MENNKPRLMYSCKIFDVLEEDIRLANGKTTTQIWIQHKPSVAVIAINDSNELLLIKQYRVAVKQNLLEIPAGSLDTLEENPLECAQRELAEETGFKANSMVKLYEGYLTPGYCTEYMYFFLAQGLYFDPLAPDEDEYIETIPTALAQARQMLKKGEIIDAKTAFGITLAVNYLNNNKA